MAQSVQLHDERLSLSLFAEDPDIVTPIGLAVGPDDGIYVIESHTHLPPKAYKGPKSDRIKVFYDRDADGQSDDFLIYADGLTEAMNLAFSPSGELYVVCSREVVKLTDDDQDGFAEKHERVLHLETSERYAHNSLLSITIDGAGKLYVGRGNTGSRHYAIRGSDGSFVEGYGDGGSVAVSAPNGANVAELATGFWNPFDLKFDMDGNLLLVDNDPDARGPNRLLEVVSGGDYGYKSLYGGAGNHPFQGWDGSLPGTLPYISGTGEAPSGLIDLRRSSFPRDYRTSILATIWNENSVERFQLSRSEAGVKCEKSVLLTGPKDFRPVALDCDRSGNLFLTDWVLVDYPNHGRGKIWRISAKKQANRMSPAPYFVEPRKFPTIDTDATALAELLVHPNALSRHRAVEMLRHDRWSRLREELSMADDPKLRTAVALAEMRNGNGNRGLIRKFLSDRDERVRLTALLWAGQSGLAELSDDVDLVLRSRNVSALLFEAWIAAKECLTEEFISAYRNRSQSRSNQIPRQLETSRVLEVAKNSNLSSAVRALAIQRLPEKSLDGELKFLLDCLAGSDKPMALAAIDGVKRTIRGSSSGRVITQLMTVARDSKRDAEIRIAAIDCCGAMKADLDSLSNLVGDPNPRIAYAAATALRENAGTPQAQRILDRVLLELPTKADPLQMEQLLYAKFGNDPNANKFASERPATRTEWQKSLSRAGDAERGAWVFRSPRIGCTKCHSVDGRGALLGPDLSRVAQSKSREQIIDSILDPSADFPPQYQAWLVVTDDGQVHRGLQLDHKAGGAIVMLTTDAVNVRFEGDEIVDYRASPTSLMPDGLEESMSVTELRDLVEYLTQLK